MVLKYVFDLIFVFIWENRMEYMFMKMYKYFFILKIIVIRES